MTDFQALKAESEQAVREARDVAALEEVRVLMLGKKGKVTELLKNVATLAPEARKDFGASVNRLKEEVTALIEARKTDLSAHELQEKLAREKVDVTLPIRAEAKGAIHPITQTIEEIVALLAPLGFTVAEGPDIETDFHNFTALNMPANHPARAMQDSFYLRDSGTGGLGDSEPPSPPAAQLLVLRTHTSPVQIRTMLSQKPPIRILAPGRAFRCDYDQTHTPMFHQIEGLVIDQNIHFGHLKGVLMDFLRAFFGVPDLKVRFRPSYFPFTEPSAEVDIGCSRAGGTLKIGAGDDWLEVLGCGMVNEKVLKNCCIDPALHQGFAFGAGIERLAMLKYGIPDLRTFYESDLRWLKHYGFAALDIPHLACGI
jgi:phenylalanyl-tRNA synthetase alpha chain